jgi:transcriptional regulator with XRE-family HTH domain
VFPDFYKGDSVINKALRIIRQFHNIKQVELADQLKISKLYLSEIESGKKPASLDLLEQYSAYFDIPVSSLVFFSESLNKTPRFSESFRIQIGGKLLSVMDWFINRDINNAE